MRILPAIACLLVCSTALAQARVWNTTSGEKIEAEYVRYAYGIVVLKTPEGKQVRIQLSRLSPEDLAYVDKKLKGGSAPDDKSSDSRRTSPGNPEVVAQMTPGKRFTRKADGETGMTYHVYVPTSFKSDAPPPLIIAFSPGGGGMGMVNALRASAEKAGWLVAGCDRLSNSSKADVRGKMEDEVLDDILKSVPHQIDRRWLAGFSGGAMRCYGLAVRGRRPEVYAGILAFGGWMGGRKYRQKKYDPGMVVAQINGAEDKGANSWTKGDAAALEKNGCVAREFKFPGGHGIAPPDVIDKAIAWLVEQRTRLERQAKRRTRRR